MMDAPILLAATGLSLGALYFLLAAGLSLVLGLMNVLSLVHGAYLTVSAYVGWRILLAFNGNGDVTTLEMFTAIAIAVLAGGLLGLLTEVLLIRPLYERDPLDALLGTLGLALILVALIRGLWRDEQTVPVPGWVRDTTSVFGAPVPNDRFLVIAGAVVAYGLIQLMLRRTRHGLIVRAGVENREMVRALGIDVRRSFTLIFALGGLAAGLGGAMGAIFLGGINPNVGDSFLIFAFIVLIVGGLSSLPGALIAAVLVGLVQQFANYYLSAGAGEIIAVALMALVLLTRPEGLFGKKGRLV